MEKIVEKQASLIIVGFIFFIISGCVAVGPDYKPVTLNIPSQWHTNLHHGLSLSLPSDKDNHVRQGRNTAMAQWWKLLKDPVMEALEQEVIQNNLNVKEAIEKIREVRALRGISYAELFPGLNGSTSVNRSRSSENSGNGSINNVYQAGLDAGWELDLFGGVRRSIEAADADIAATRYSLDGVLVSLTAEVGLNYVNMRTLQARITILKTNLALQKQIYDLNQSRYRAGLIDELAVHQSLYNLEQTRSQLPELEKGLSDSMNRLAVLVGKNPGSLKDKLSIARPVPAVPLIVAVGIPAEAMRRRPDIRQAEAELIAETARIGVATADLYPKLSLKGLIGLESLSMDDLPAWASHTFTAGPSVSWNIFDGNSIRRNIDVHNSRQKQALIHYQSTVLNALEEVENALGAFAKEQEKRRTLVRAAQAAGRAESIARDRFNAGLIDFLNVLDAQRSLLSFQDELALSTGAVTTDLISLYKALGGGWMSDDKNKKLQ